MDDSRAVRNGVWLGVAAMVTIVGRTTTRVLHDTAAMWLGVTAMVVIVAASNFLVQYPINDWLTYGAFSYPVSFLVTDLMNRAHGPPLTRRVVYVGFAVAVVFSAWLATPRIAVASGTAFLAAQLTDIAIFHRLRRSAWWRAPLISSLLSSVLDTALFFGLAFVATGLPWVTWALGDLAVKLAVAGVMLIPFRLLMSFVRSQTSFGT